MTAAGRNRHANGGFGFIEVSVASHGRTPRSLAHWGYPYCMESRVLRACDSTAHLGSTGNSKQHVLRRLDVMQGQITKIRWLSLQDRGHGDRNVGPLFVVVRASGVDKIYSVMRIGPGRGEERSGDVLLVISVRR